jgi:hypothetical protein
MFVPYFSLVEGVSRISTEPKNEIIQGWDGCIDYGFAVLVI